MKWPHITVFLLLFSFNICAQRQQRPARGSIDFGTDSAPIKIQKQDMEPFMSAFVEVAETVIPSVVSVIPTLVDTGNFFQNSIRRFLDNQVPHAQQQQERRVQGLGSGFIVSSKGYILTNYHVIAGAEETEVLLTNGNIYPTEVVGSDSLSDIAVLKMTGKLPDLKAVYLGNSDSLKPGDWVAAIGNPFALTSTITSGIVSALGREIPDPLAFQNFIQIDAAVNPGNSGGPLVNLEGAVMGMNTLIFSKTGGFMGVGFAIPINLAQRVMEDLIYEGRVIRGYVGISIQEITPQLQEALDLKTAQGALVADVVPQQPAAKAGIKTGDIIISITNKTIEGANELRNTIASIRPGEKVPITLLRNGKQIKTTIIPIERTPEVLQKQQPARRRPRPQRGIVNNKLGIGVTQITPELRNRLNIPKNLTGVIVTRIAPEVVDERAMLLAGVVITQAKVSGTDWVNIQSVPDFEKFADSVKNGQAVALQIFQNGQTFFVSFEIDL